MASTPNIRGRGAAYLVLLISLVPTLIVYYRVKENVAARNQARFVQAIRTSEAELRQRLDLYLETLRGVRGLLRAAPELQSRQWEDYLGSLDVTNQLPAIKTIGFAPRITRAALQQPQGLWIQNRARYQSELGTRSEFFPLVHFSSFNGATSGAMPRELGDDQPMALAISKAIETGESQIKLQAPSQEVPLAQPRRLVSVFVPLKISSSNAPAGSAGDGVVVGQLLSSLLFRSLLPQPTGSHIRYEIFEGHDASLSGLIFDDDNVLDSRRNRPDYSSARRIFQPQAKSTASSNTVLWSIHFRALPSFENRWERNYPLFALAGGLTVSLVLFGIALWEVRERAAAQRLSVELEESRETFRHSNDQLQRTILEQEKTARLLAHERYLLASILDTIPDRVFFKDRDGRIIKCSREVARFLGLSNPEEAIGKSDLQLFSDQHGQSTLDEEKRIIETGRPVIGKIERETWKDGKVSWALTTKMPFKDKDGKIIGTFGTSKDITSLKESEEALAAEKERLAVTLRSIGEGVITTDTGGTITLMNSAAEVLTGWSQSDAVGKQLDQVLHAVGERSRKPLPDPIRLVLMDGNRFWQSEPGLLRSVNGTETLVSLGAAPLAGPTGHDMGLVLVIRDITDQQRAEAERLKASKLESIGVLAGGIAHDFNNILTAVVGNLSLAKMCVHSTEKMLARVADAEKSALRAKDLTNQLLTFSKGGAPIKRAVPLVPIIREAVQFALRGSNVEPEYSLPNELWSVEVDEGQISQVLHNVVMNGRDSMPDGGRLEVRAENVELIGHRPSSLPPGRYVKITVRDFGVGIPPEHLSKIFDPYFTTKDEASGLGLATTYSIIRKHGGQISLESALGKGTAVYIYLQASAKSVPAKTSDTEQFRFFGEGKVLVMDDEEDVRVVAGAMLEILGYEVALAADGAEAIEQYMREKALGRPFLALIMDLTVPNGLGGKETMRRLRELDPQVRGIVSSGYSYDPVMANFRDYGFSGVMPKPYKISDMGRVLQEVLNPNLVPNPPVNNDPFAQKPDHEQGRREDAKN